MTLDISEAIILIVFILGGIVGVFIGMCMYAKMVDVIDDMVKEDKGNE